MKIHRYFILFIVLCSSLFTLAAESVFEGIQNPVITSIYVDEENPLEIVVEFNLETDGKKVNKGLVEMFDENGKLIESKTVGRSKKIEKKAVFEAKRTGEYTFIAKGINNKSEETLDGETVSFSYTYPLFSPSITVKNLGDNTIYASWDVVKEAGYYLVSLDGKLRRVDSTDITYTGLEENKRYEITVYAVRSYDDISSSTIYKTARAEADREWKFSFFGQSTKEDRNRIEILDADNLALKMYSCTTNSDGSDIQDKGGKFTAFHDGITYYYTEIDPERENFELTATFEIDFINPIADGQEGFGILAMDSLGAFGVSGTNHYTNSAGVIATKFEETIGGNKKTSKDTLGARFVTGLTEEIISGGDSLIAEKGRSLGRAYSYDSSELVKKGDVYTITLKMDNTGFHAIYRRPNLDEFGIDEYILYGKEELLQIEKDKIYVGLAVARGCNVTVRDISLKITNPLTDPPAEEEPPEYVPYDVKVDSPLGWYNEDYKFVFSSNADGTLSVKNKKNLVIDSVKVKAFEDYSETIAIKKGINDLTVTFTPDSSFIPWEGAVMASYDNINKKYYESYAPIVISQSVIYVPYDGDTLYVSPKGSSLGKGTYKDPLDLMSAIHYSAPGQTIVLKDGVYTPYDGVKIERGNSGKEGAVKTLKTENRGKAILDFSYASSAMQVWGDWWVIDGLEIKNSAENVKGLQIAGDYNVIQYCYTHHCGDTGLQISGTSGEPYDKWPHHNYVFSCISHDNKDPAENNADGFAAKLTVREGNVFDSCVAYSNIDDGWDLFAKIETGPIGEVTIKNCVAFKNGSLSTGIGNGDGNGFKLGGDGIAVAHVLENSVAFDNGKSGITSNSDPAIILRNVTSFRNNTTNVSLYGKGDGSRLFVAEGVVSVDGYDADDVSEMPELESDSNFFFNGGQSMNKSGAVLKESDFESTVYEGFERRDDGTISLGSFLRLKDSTLEVGAHL